jgi:hypothetical protein
VQALAEQAGLDRPEDFARSWHILMKGAIVSASEGDTQAANRAQEMAGWLIEHHSRRIVSLLIIRAFPRLDAVRHTTLEAVRMR